MWFLFSLTTGTEFFSIIPSGLLQCSSRLHSKVIGGLGNLSNFTASTCFSTHVEKKLLLLLVLLVLLDYPKFPSWTQLLRMSLSLVSPPTECALNPTVSPPSVSGYVFPFVLPVSLLPGHKNENEGIPNLGRFYIS